MFDLSQRVSLKEYNTFGISVYAKYFLSIHSAEDLIDFYKLNKEFLNEERLILGGGSNLLFLGNFEGLIIYPQMKEIKVLEETTESVEVVAEAGVVWDDFVDFCVTKGWGGVENLSLIPGNVGAVPVQNIGAYGVEVESCIVSVNTLDLQNFGKMVFKREDCHFGYRNSIFKKELKNKYLVTSVVFRLMKQPSFNISYGALSEELAKFEEVNLRNIRKAVISIRNSKLPDPKIIGNAGSFFKNPVVKTGLSERIQKQYPSVPVYPCGNGKVKLAAGWLIEQSGWKGKSLGNAAVHEKQALVLVNRGNATGEDIYRLSEKIQQEVYAGFNIRLEPEVNIIGAVKNPVAEITA